MWCGWNVRRWDDLVGLYVSGADHKHIENSECLPFLNILMGLCRIDYIKKNSKLRKSNLLVFKVISLGLEPRTHSLEGCCSIQLSYETLFEMQN